MNALGIVIVSVAVIVILGLLSQLVAQRARVRALVSELELEHSVASERDQLARARSDFLATASHELRSPLTSVKGFVELLENGSRDGRFNEREREFVEIIGRSTDRLVALVDELLEVAQLDADHVRLRRRPIDVGEAIQELAELMGPRLRDKQQRLGVYVAPTLPLAYADAERVRQVIGNLLTNAHLYTPPGGRIHIGAEPDRAWVRIVVADSGVGMAAEETARAFDRFYRAPSGSAAVQGTGLGLSIVRSLVELHAGEIDVASRPGVGTTFRVRLPAARAEAEDAREILRGRRVLVAAGAPGAEAVVSALTVCDADAQVITDAHGVLDALTAERHDAVVLEVGPGSGSGSGSGVDDAAAFAVARAIRADAELHGTPIVFLAAGTDPRLAGEWTATAPDEARELRAVLAAAVRTGRARVLVIAREELQATLEPALDDLGIEYEWESSGPAAARACGERRFELALVDAGLRNPEATLEALALASRRLRHAVIMFGDGAGDRPGVVAAADAPRAVLAALRGDRPDAAERIFDGAV